MYTAGKHTFLFACVYGTHSNGAYHIYSFKCIRSIKAVSPLIISLSQCVTVLISTYYYRFPACGELCYMNNIVDGVTSMHINIGMYDLRITIISG